MKKRKKNKNWWQLLLSSRSLAGPATCAATNSNSHNRRHDKSPNTIIPSHGSQFLQLLTEPSIPIN
uniref:Secreted protein n=1 Tax=Rhizophora mucronata TaxID=61149 RepID=A0A2P2MVH6_RHIMU